MKITNRHRSLGEHPGEPQQFVSIDRPLAVLWVETRDGGERDPHGRRPFPPPIGFDPLTFDRDREPVLRPRVEEQRDQPMVEIVEPIAERMPVLVPWPEVDPLEPLGVHVGEHPRGAGEPHEVDADDWASFGEVPADRLDRRPRERETVRDGEPHRLVARTRETTERCGRRARVRRGDLLQQQHGLKEVELPGRFEQLAGDRTVGQSELVGVG